MKKLVYIPVAVGVLAFGGVVLANSETAAVNGKVTDDVQEVATEKMMSTEEISAKALELANGRITDIELDTDDKRANYEVEIDFDGYEYDIEFDAYTGEVLEQKREKDNAEKSQTATAGEFISSDEAIKAALATVNGTFEGFELKAEENPAYYEVEVQDGRIEHEVDVNAKDGSILNVASDEEDDDDDDRD
ncbi:PepSY domain-containing protein [Planococcus sp. ANT_H30]|uniref:PepSY domain-containing protein n=1 Tax=Planococcus sp. ANT_H30 TaxID=2597347 RepID=UPI00165D495C|nr:PepSY domain-containing protein [Planococcus sp. ANT_H30]